MLSYNAQVWRSRLDQSLAALSDLRHSNALHNNSTKHLLDDVTKFTHLQRQRIRKLDKRDVTEYDEKKEAIASEDGELKHIDRKSVV